jgi:phosphotransferase system HPr-like phosphotransfer protein
MPLSPRSSRRFPVVFAIAAIVVALPHSRVIAVAQSAQPCALLTTEDIQPLAYQQTVAPGVAASYAATGFSACRYAWGTGLDRYKLEVNISDSSRMFAGLAPGQVKRALQSIVVKDTADMIVSDVGDAAIFKAESPVYVQATAVIKGRVLQLSLDGLDAREKKGEVIALLKQAASKF